MYDGPGFYDTVILIYINKKKYMWIKSKEFKKILGLSKEVMNIE